MTEQKVLMTHSEYNKLKDVVKEADKLVALWRFYGDDDALDMYDGLVMAVDKLHE